MPSERMQNERARAATRTLARLISRERRLITRFFRSADSSGEKASSASDLRK